MTFARRTHWLSRGVRAAFTRTRAAGPRRVLLTFDDGAHPEHTPAVLDRLRAFGAAAAFFPVGERLAAAPHVVGAIAAGGHAIGNHTFSHARFRWWDVAGPRRDVDRCQALIPAARLFRPPFGRLTPGLWLAARRHRLACVWWSLDSGDWRCRSAADAAACAAQVVRRVRPGDVVLFHDDHPHIGPILDAVLPDLARRGLLGGPDPLSW